MRKLILSLVLVVALLIVGVVIAQVISTLKTTVNVTISPLPVEQLSFVGMHEFDLDLNRGRVGEFELTIANASGEDIWLYLYQGPVPIPPNTLTLIASKWDWVVPAQGQVTIPLGIEVDYMCPDGDYVVDIIFQLM